jgi:hypothetical protein
VAEMWAEPPRFGSTFREPVQVQRRSASPFLLHGWVRFLAWSSPEDYVADVPSTPVAFQVIHVAMVHTVMARPDLTCVVLRDGRWYVAMALEDVLRVMEVLT